jgi:hypothetical protein
MQAASIVPGAADVPRAHASRAPVRYCQGTDRTAESCSCPVRNFSAVYPDSRGVVARRGARRWPLNVNAPGEQEEGRRGAAAGTLPCHVPHEERSKIIWPVGSALASTCTQSQIRTNRPFTGMP